MLMEKHDQKKQKDVRYLWNKDVRYDSLLISEADYATIAKESTRVTGKGLCTHFTEGDCVQQDVGPLSRKFGCRPDMDEWTCLY